MSAPAGATMPAYRIVEWGAPAEMTEVPVPAVGPNDVLVRMAAVGLCHTDIHLLDAEPGEWPFPVPFTLGHENAGTVEALGSAVAGLAPGTAVAVAGGPRCGVCLACLRGHDDACARRATGRGFGEDGGLASYLVVPARELVPLSGLTPVQAAPLADAALTPYHAVKRVSPKLPAGSTAAVIGCGGLGGFAVQFLAMLTPARIVAVDVSMARAERALRLGAHQVAVTDDTLGALAELAGEGIDVVLDLVGTSATMRAALATVRPNGAVAIVGAAGGTAEVGWGLVPPGCDVFISLAGTLADFHEVISLAEAGRLEIEVETFPFADVARAYGMVRAGAVGGRAVVEMAS